MNCNEAMSLLPVYSDGELDPVQSAEIEKHVLPEHQFLLDEVSDSDQKDVRPRPAREARRLRIEEKDVRPDAGSLAFEPEVRE